MGILSSSAIIFIYLKLIAVVTIECYPELVLSLDKQGDIHYFIWVISYCDKALDLYRLGDSQYASIALDAHVLVRTTNVNE